MFLPSSFSLPTGGERSTLSPGWLVPGSTSPGLKEPEDLGHFWFFGVELHFNLFWELGLLLWGALYPSGSASSLLI